MDDKAVLTHVGTEDNKMMRKFLDIYAHSFFLRG